MDRIPHTYWNDNPEDRQTGSDFWAWLQHQPLQAWLFYARGANWDNGDLIIEDMAAHPRCDLALASWLFWHSDPAYWLERGEIPPNGLLPIILDRCNGDGFPSVEVHYDRTEVAWEAFRTARLLRGLDRPPAFHIPAQLCRNFKGHNSPIGPYSQDVEQDLAEIFDDDPGRHSGIWGTLYRSDDEYFDDMRRGGNWWFEPALRLPVTPKLTAEMSEVELIDAVFGEHQSSLRRIEEERARANKQWRHSVVHDVNKWGMTNDPVQRAIGLGLFGLSVVLLALLLWFRPAQ